ncbi:MAG: PilZ domain-containing protein, partial [Deltaproteobacteria bacterium]|nr:PilZ domain-containing protein [Deltaproteobacteria bacterium]
MSNTAGGIKAPDSTTIDGRQYYRLPKNYSVEVKELAFPMTNAGVIKSSVNDISIGGICIESS